MKMSAPEGVTSAAVENDQYEVDEHGQIEVENGEHIPQLEVHGFVQVADAEGDTASEPVDEVGECPDFSKFVNRQALVDYLVAHGDDSHRADEPRAALETCCVACFESGAERAQPEAVEADEDEDPPVETDEDPPVETDEDEDAAK